MHLRHLLTILTAVIGFTAFVSCQDSENGGGSGEKSQFKKNTYYAVQDTANGWEEGIYYNGTFLMAHANRSKGTILYYLDNSQHYTYKAVLFEVDPEDNHILRIGGLDLMSEVCESDGKLTVFEVSHNNSDELDARTVEITDKHTATQPASSRAAHTKGLLGDWTKSMIEKLLTKNIPHLDDLLTACNFTEDMHDEKWVKASLTILTAGISKTAGSSAGAATLPLSWAAQEYEAQVSKVQEFLYGNAGIKITDVKKRSDGGYNVTVEIEGANNIPNQITQNHTELGACVQKIYTNDVYCGVLARDVIDPWYNRTDVRSGEIRVGKTSEYRVQYTLVIYPTGDHIKLRPYLISDLDFLGKERFKLSCDFVRHGETVPLAVSDVDFTFRQTAASCEATYSHDNECYEDKKVHFQFEFNATCNAYGNKNITAIRDWGFEIFRSGQSFHKFSMISESDGQNSGNVTSATSTQDFSVDENEMFIDYNSLTAVTDGDYTVCSYIEYTTGYNLSDFKTAYGEPVPIELKYDQKPSFRFTGAKYLGTYTSNNPQIPYGAWCKGTTLGMQSENQYECQLQGLLFLKTCMLKKSGGGWNQYCDAWYAYGGTTPWQTAPWAFNEGYTNPYGAYNLCKFAFYSPEKVGKGALDVSVDLVIAETGRHIAGANKISYEPYYAVSSGGETYIKGFQAVVK